MNSAQIFGVAAMSYGSVIGLSEVAGLNLDWKDLASGGSATMVVVIVILFLRAQAEMRQEHAATVSKISHDFGEAMKAATDQMRLASEQFAASTTIILKESRQHSEASMTVLQEIIQDIHRSRA
jgi:hypothetical protein